MSLYCREKTKLSTQGVVCQYSVVSDSVHTFTFMWLIISRKGICAMEPFIQSYSETSLVWTILGQKKMS